MSGRTDLDAGRLGERLSRVPFVTRTVVLGITGSTNDDLRALADDGAAEGTIVVASGQTRGRGRLGRAWDSPERMGCYLSVLLRPTEPPELLARYGLAAGVAVAEACRALLGERVGLKWPNDVLASGKKLAGILTEARQGRWGPEVVLGIGVNVHQTREEFAGTLFETATSIRLEHGQVAREEVAAMILESLAGSVADLRAGGWDRLAARFLRYAPSVSGARVRLRSGGSGVTGGLDPTGALRVVTPEGPVLVHTGESVLFLGE